MNKWNGYIEPSYDTKNQKPKVVTDKGRLQPLFTTTNFTCPHCNDNNSIRHNYKFCGACGGAITFNSEE